MNKIKLGVILGGMSTEHDVSVISGTSVISNLNKEKYEIYPIYINTDGTWYKYQGTVSKEALATNKIENVFDYLKELDVIFPVLHGLYGEDGSIQGLLELINKPYVGCKILSSSIAMDKVYAKIIFEKAGIKQSKYMYIKALKDTYIFVDKNFKESTMNLEEICTLAEKELHYPIFVKPSNSGSSIGISKASNQEELIQAIQDAAQYDTKLLLEEQIVGKEIECSVLGNEVVKASALGEIIPADSFYSYDAKYNNSQSKTLIPARISKDLESKVQSLAIKAFKAIDGKGFSRVDFFVSDTTNEIYINEINTIPGFTEISMYPKLWEYSGLKYSNLLDELINLAMN